MKRRLNIFGFTKQATAEPEVDAKEVNAKEVNAKEVNAKGRVEAKKIGKKLTRKVKPRHLRNLVKKDSEYIGGGPFASRGRKDFSDNYYHDKLNADAVDPTRTFAQNYAVGNDRSANNGYADYLESTGGRPRGKMKALYKSYASGSKTLNSIDSMNLNTLNNAGNGIAKTGVKGINAMFKNQAFAADHSKSL